MSRQDFTASKEPDGNYFTVHPEYGVINCDDTGLQLTMHANTLPFTIVILMSGT